MERGQRLSVLVLLLLILSIQRKTEPVITVYEAQANLADHEKIQGMDGNYSLPQP